MNDFDRKRLNANLEILKIIEVTLKKYPSMRFGQFIDNFINNYHLFNEEPWETLKHLKEHLKSSGYEQ